MMRNHLWLLIVTLACYATVSYGDTKKMPLADDPIINEMLATTEESKPNTGFRTLIHKIPMADDPR